MDPFAFIWSNLMGPNSQLGSAMAKRKLKKHKVTSPFRSFLSSTCFSPLVCQRSLVLYSPTRQPFAQSFPDCDARGYLALRNIQTLKMCNYSVSAIACITQALFPCSPRTCIECGRKKFRLFNFRFYFMIFWSTFSILNIIFSLIYNFFIE